MARIRTVKPEFWTDEKIVELSPFARLLFIGLWNFADDEGRMTCAAKSIKARVLPCDDVSIHGLLSELSLSALVKVYGVHGIGYLEITGFRKHQRINRPTDSTIPAPDQDDGSFSLNAHGSLNEHSLGKGKEGKGGERSGAEQPRAKSDSPDPALAIIGLFDQIQLELFGDQRRTFPAGTDLVYARRWLENGADAALLESLFRSRFAAMRANEDAAPRSLKYSDAAVADALRGKPPQAPSSPPDPELERRCNKHNAARQAAWDKGLRLGDLGYPTDAEFGLKRTPNGPVLIDDVPTPNAKENAA